LYPGAQIMLGDRQFTVGEMGSATYASALGEIPYRLDPNETFWFIDLADGHGGFATIDYGTDGASPTVYVGSQVNLKDLGIFGGEVMTQNTRRAQGGKLPCPNCGGSLELKAPDQTLRVACPYCNHLVSVQSGNLQVIARLARKASPKIALGTKGKFKDGELTVIGYVERAALVDGQWWAFEEYLLYAPGTGFRWLVCSDGHWSYVQPVAPGAVSVSPVKYEGVTFDLFQRADLRVDVVLGEFYWLVEAGERVVAEDYIAPPAMLSCETSKTEQQWSLSSYMTPKEVSTAFAPTEIALPSPAGVGPNQPYALHGIGKVATAVTLALFAVGMFKCSTAKNDIKTAHSGEITPGAPPMPVEGSTAEMPNVAFTPAFTLEGGKNIEIDLESNVSNNWAFVAVDLVNEKTGSVVSFDKSIEWYFGSDGGESWTEGSPRVSQTLGPMPAGEYVMRLEGQTGSSSPVTLAVTVRQDVFRMMYFGIALLVLGIPFGLIAFHAHNFKKRRWENSSIVRSTESDDDDHGGSYDFDDD
jgi:hypothetical protein